MAALEYALILDPSSSSSDARWTAPVSFAQRRVWFVARVRSSLGVEIPLGALFSRPTIAAMAELIAEGADLLLTVDRP